MSTPDPWIAGAALLASYALGCANTGYYYVRSRRGIDVRSIGSGGTGATNAGRVAGRSGFVCTLLGDAGKGVLAVMLIPWLGLAPAWAWWAGAACVAGHVWPVQLGWRGGRGVATWIGAIVTLDAWLALWSAAAAAAWAWPARRLGWGKIGIGLCAIGSTPALAALLGRGPTAVFATAALAAIVAHAHRPAVRRPLTTVTEEAR